MRQQVLAEASYPEYGSDAQVTFGIVNAEASGFSETLKLRGKKREKKVMRLRGSWILIILALAVVGLVGLTVYAQKQNRTRQTAWEYKIVNSLSEEQLNQLGAEGWELVSVAISGNNSSQYLKRAK